MSVLVDTPVWSLALRRQSIHLNPIETRLREVFSELVRAGQIRLLGVIRQEVLSGIREDDRFRRLRDLLGAFPDPPLAASDYEEAAHFHNQCRAKGVAGSAIDFLICAVACRRDWQVLTTDLDFERYAKIIGVRLFLLK